MRLVALGRQADLELVELGYAYLSGFTLAELAETQLEQLVAQVGESSSLCVLVGDDIVHVARVPTSRIMTAGITVGTRFPAHVTSVGHVMLAQLPDEEIDARLARIDLRPLTGRTPTSADRVRTELRRVRRQGYAVVDQELEEGLTSVAAPVRDRAGEVVAAVNIPVLAGRYAVESLRRDLLPQLLATVARIEADLAVAGTATGRAGAMAPARPAAVTGRARAATPGTGTHR